MFCASFITSCRSNLFHRCTPKPCPLPLIPPSASVHLPNHFLNRALPSEFTTNSSFAAGSTSTNNLLFGSAVTFPIPAAWRQPV
jgi:hypothetical protein